MVPLMLLYTARPEFHAPWPMRSHHSQITLARLSRRNVRQMVSLVAANNALVAESVDAVIERTGGVPLFVEELTRAVLESSSERIPHEIPATLRDSLMARLDRLGLQRKSSRLAQSSAMIFPMDSCRRYIQFLSKTYKRLSVERPTRSWFTSEASSQTPTINSNMRSSVKSPTKRC